VIFTKSLARTSVGKADKKKLRAEYQNIYRKGSANG
jgi:acyl-CoA synthetase (AMP-forming)/AMP-acid ligase II